MKAVVSPDAETVTLSGKLWSETFPARDLPDRLAFYRSLRDRNGKGGPGPYAKFYAPTVASLERAEKIARALGTLK